MRIILLLFLFACSAKAQERLFVFRENPEVPDHIGVMQKFVNPMLANGWTVKALSTYRYHSIIVLAPPTRPAEVPNGPRQIVPGGLEERRKKMLEAKIESPKQ